MRHFLMLLALGLLLVACDVNGNLTSNPASGAAPPHNKRSADYALQQAQQQQPRRARRGQRDGASPGRRTTRGLSPRRRLLRRWTLHAPNWP